jgi:hypothetical protein
MTNRRYEKWIESGAFEMATNVGGEVSACVT